MIKTIIGAALLAAILLAATSLEAASPQPPILTELTHEFFVKIKQDKSEQLAYLAELEETHNFPEGTFRIKWAIESMCGERNIRNKKGYEGHFQYGEYEIKRWKVRNPKDFKQAADALPNFLNDYHKLFQTYAVKPVAREDRTPMDWYHMHQMGFRGAAQQWNTAIYKEKLPNDIKRNMLGNIPKELLPQFNSLSDQDFTLKFYQMWDMEAYRIWKELE